jgi:hypothetical protein
MDQLSIGVLEYFVLNNKVPIDTLSLKTDAQMGFVLDFYWKTEYSIRVLDMYP